MLRLFAVFVACFLATYCWFPLSGKFFTAVPSFYPDLYEFLWNFWIFRNHSNDIFSQNTELLFAPYGSSLSLHTSVPGVVVPLVLLAPELNETALFNLAVIALVTMNFVAAVWCMRRLGALWEVAIIGSAIIAFHPFFLGHLQAGHLNFLCFAPVMVALGLSARANHSISVFDGGLLSLALGWAALTNLYYFYFSFLIIALFAVSNAIVLRRDALAGLGKLAIYSFGGLILSTPTIVAVWTARQSGKFTADHDPAKHSVDLSQIFLPGDRQWSSTLIPHWIARPDTLLGMHEASVYVPWSLFIIIGVFLLIRRSDWRAGRPFFLFGLFSVILACGPTFTVFGDRICANLIFEAVRVLPAFPSVPARFGILASTFLICGAVVIAGRHKRTLFAMMLIAVLEIFPTPLRGLDIASSPVLDRLARSSLYRVVDADGVSNMVLGAQIFHGRQVVGGFLSRRPRKVEAEYRRNPFLAALWRSKSSSRPAMWHGFMQLKADGVLVRRALAQPSALMSGLPCFKLADEDASFQLFLPDSGLLCTK